MNSEYKKKVIQGPRSYEEINSNRPTKKRVFNYSMPEETPTDFRKNYERTKYQDYSFEHRQDSFGKENKIQKYRAEKEPQESIIYDSSPTKELSKRYDVDQRLTNISSINDKISGLLNAARTKRQDGKQICRSPLNRNQEKKEEKHIQQDFAPSYRVPFEENEDEEAYREKVRSALRAKYDLPSEEGNLTYDHKALNSKRIDSISNRRCRQIDSSEVIEFKGTPQVQILKENPVKVTSFSYQADKRPFKDAEISIRTQNEQKQKKLIDNLVLDRQIEEIKQKIFENSPFNPKHSSPDQEKSTKREEILKLLSPQLPKQTEKPETLKLAETLSLLIEVDKTMFNYRQAFQSLKDDKKWSKLKSELHSLGIFPEENDIRDLIKISIHEKNPFQTAKGQYSLNITKDLSRLLSQSLQIWNQQLQKCVSLDSLADQEFSMNLIDFNSKGTISIEDLVCFININSGKFYRSREVANLFDRFLRIEGKSIDRDLSGGIKYSTLMDKVAG